MEKQFFYSCFFFFPSARALNCPVPHSYRKPVSWWVLLGIPSAHNNHWKHESVHPWAFWSSHWALIWPQRKGSAPLPGRSPGGAWASLRPSTDLNQIHPPPLNLACIAAVVDSYGLCSLPPWLGSPAWGSRGPLPAPPAAAAGSKGRALVSSWQTSPSLAVPLLWEALSFWGHNRCWEHNMPTQPSAQWRTGKGKDSPTS